MGQGKYRCRKLGLGKVRKQRNGRAKIEITIELLLVSFHRQLRYNALMRLN